VYPSLEPLSGCRPGGPQLVFSKEAKIKGNVCEGLFVFQRFLVVGLDLGRRGGLGFPPWLSAEPH
jgi:hypothetical protein